MTDIDKNEFFRQATLRICGNLDIAKALVSCVQYLREVMPLDRVFLQRYDHGLKAMRTVGTATPTEGQTLDLLTPISTEIHASTMKDYGAFSNAVVIDNEPDKKALSREMLRFHGVQATSLMLLMLELAGRQVGSAVFVSEGSGKYDAKHTELVSLLREPFVIAMSNALQHAEILKFKEMLADDNRYLHDELSRLAGDSIVGTKFGLEEVMFQVQQVASLDSPVLLLGETGVGKDLIATAIHRSSARNKGPFIGVNCGGIAESLLDSELFGHEKGAFTGAIAQNRGRFQRAHGGTIFLDEVAELAPQAQVKLLRVLQNKEIERVGGTKTISLDTRIIAATNRDLESMVKNGEFRSDLWFRLNVFPIHIPPLRERKVDIPALVQHFMILKAGELKLPFMPVLAQNAIEPLMEYHWPGNVRELANVVERALILNRDGPVDFRGMHGLFSEEKNVDGESDELRSVTIHHIKQVLAKTNGRVHGPGGAAKLLGLNPSTLRHRMDKLSIKYGRESKKSAQ